MARLHNFLSELQNPSTLLFAFVDVYQSQRTSCSRCQSDGDIIVNNLSIQDMVIFPLATASDYFSTKIMENINPDTKLNKAQEASHKLTPIETNDILPLIESSVSVMI